MKLVQTSYAPGDVTVLLQDVAGRVPILDTQERERLNQQGVHYSEMLPLEYVPSPRYMELYWQSVSELSKATAHAVALLAEKIHRYKEQPVITSLARAGTPLGILVKRYLAYKYNISVPHYSISIIRGKGIDEKAMETITDTHSARDIIFLDGWVGKGAINKVLRESVDYLVTKDPARYKHLDSTLAVLSDPASVTRLYGTRQDFLIPSACLNATVSGLLSRTVKTSEMLNNELHGAIYYGENKEADVSNSFLDTVTKYFSDIKPDYFSPSQAESDENFKGIEEVQQIAQEYGIKDINKIKPGVGETTRVLLRRLPDRVLLSPRANERYIKHIHQLCIEKNIPIEIYPFKKYNVCGIIKEIADL